MNKKLNQKDFDLILRKIWRAIDRSELESKEVWEAVANIRGELLSFEMAVDHVTEEGTNTIRSVSSSNGWAMVGSKRLTDLECKEEELRILKASIKAKKRKKTK